MVGELASGIAHEVNNPVAIMVEEAGWIEDLLSEEDVKGIRNMNEYKRALKQIRTQGMRCKTITNKLLSFARKSDSNVQEVSLNDMIREMIGLYAQKAQLQRVAIHTDLQSDLPMASISPSEFQQVFLNLINNAIEAMGKQRGSINISTRLDGKDILLIVADTGQEL